MASSGMPVPVGQRMVCLWSRDPLHDTRQFLDSLDPTFYQGILDLMSTPTPGRQEQFAAMQIRVLRDQAAEMLFAILMGCIQALHAIPLWMTQYRNAELDELLRSIDTDTHIQTYSGLRTYSWIDVAKEVTRTLEAAEPTHLDAFRASYADFWRRLAHEYLDPIARREFNCIKHSLRVRPGGCTITLTPEKSLGTIDPQATSISLTGSGFGSSFVSADRVADHGPHFRLVNHHRHWTPSSLLLQLDLIVLSIENVIGYAKGANGHPSPGRWKRPVIDEIDVFKRCWLVDGTLLNSSSGSVFPSSGIPRVTDAALRALCNAGPGHADTEVRGIVQSD